MALLIGHAMWEIASTKQKNHPDMGSDTSLEWNFCVPFSDSILQGNQWWIGKMSALCSGFCLPRSYFGPIMQCSSPRKGKERCMTKQKQLCGIETSKTPIQFHV